MTRQEPRGHSHPAPRAQDHSITSDTVFLIRDRSRIVEPSMAMPDAAEVERRLKEAEQLKHPKISRGFTFMKVVREVRAVRTR